jgi:ABC-type transporter MlaC component
MARGIWRRAFGGVITVLLLAATPIARIAAQSAEPAAAPAAPEIGRGAFGEVNAALSLLAMPLADGRLTVSVAAPTASPPAQAVPKTAAKRAKPAHPDQKLASTHRHEPTKKIVATAKKPVPAPLTAAHETKKATAAAAPPNKPQSAPPSGAATTPEFGNKTAGQTVPPPSPAAPPALVARAAEPRTEVKTAAIAMRLAPSAETKAPAAPVTPPTAATEKPALPAFNLAARDDRKAAGVFVANFLKEAFRIAKLNGASSLQRRAALAELFAGNMDVKRIAGYTTSDQLGQKAPDIQQRFRAILVSYLVETYYPQLELASDPSVRVETATGEPLADGTAVVWTTFTKDGWGSQSVQWHLAAGNGGYRIVDIFSAGASLAQMERDTFQSVMRNGGFNELMAKLDARTKELASAAAE